MKYRLLEFIRCPVCKSALKLENPVFQRVDRVSGGDHEVMAGSLSCAGCGHRYPIDNGVPRLCPTDPSAGRETGRTVSSYGYLWDRSAVTAEARPYHLDKMRRTLSLPSPSGLTLDAGCGDGIDLANQARCEGLEIIGVELSDGGCRTSFERTLTFPAAHVVQADLCLLPFDNDSFDFVYSYGVLHHLRSPKEGLQELVRTLKPGARAAAYLYEDFSDRAVVWRRLLAAANQLRRVTPRLPHHVLYHLCKAAAPVIYALFTIPFLLLSRIPRIGFLAAGFPFRHATGPFSLAGDLYDRFSVPIEWRYSRAKALALFQDAGLQDVMVAKDRGWMVAGIKSRNPMSIPERQGVQGRNRGRADLSKETGKVREC